MRVVLLCGTALIVHGFVASSVLAQTTSAWIDAGGAQVQQRLGKERQAGTIGAGVHTQRRNWSLTGEAAMTAADDSIGAAQFIARAGYAPTRARWSLSELEVSTTTLGIRLPNRDGNRSILFREQADLRVLQLFGSIAWSNTSRYRLNSHSDVLTAGARTRFGPVSFTASAQRSHTDDWQLMEASGVYLGLNAPADTKWYDVRDAIVDARVQWRRATLSVGRTWRGGYSGTLASSTANMFTASWHAHDAWQLLAYSGRQLADPLRGVPQADVSGVAIRYWIGSRRNAKASTVSGAEYQLEQRDGASLLTLRIDAPANARVEVATSATEWTRVAATREGDRYVARVSLNTGTHRVAVRINGGEWRAPRGLVRVSDDFGGNAGLIVVP